jgi:hypothetical protein
MPRRSSGNQSAGGCSGLLPQHILDNLRTTDFVSQIEIIVAAEVDQCPAVAETSSAWQGIDHTRLATQSLAFQSFQTMLTVMNEFIAIHSNHHSISPS